jgi:hypothetical protein
MGIPYPNLILVKRHNHFFAYITKKKLGGDSWPLPAHSTIDVASQFNARSDMASFLPGLSPSPRQVRDGHGPKKRETTSGAEFGVGSSPSQPSIWEVVVTMQNNFRSYLSAKLGRDFAGRAAGLLSIFSPWRLRAFAPLRCYRLKTAACRDVRVGSVLRFLNLLHWKRIGMNNKYRFGNLT